MGKRVKLGGELLGSGNKISVKLDSTKRSTHNKEQAVVTAMGVGPIVPLGMMKLMPGDDFDLPMRITVRGDPALGPLTGSYLIDARVIKHETRLYNRVLHNRKRGVATKISSILTPRMRVKGATADAPYLWDGTQVWNEDGFSKIPSKALGQLWQVHPDSLVSYLRIRGLGCTPGAFTAADKVIPITRYFDAEFLCAYMDACKVYYMNQQEEYVPYLSVDNETSEASVGVDQEGPQVVSTPTYSGKWRGDPMAQGAMIAGLQGIPSNPTPDELLKYFLTKQNILPGGTTPTTNIPQVRVVGWDPMSLEVTVAVLLSDGTWEDGYDLADLISVVPRDGDTYEMTFKASAVNTLVAGKRVIGYTLTSLGVEDKTIPVIRWERVAAFDEFREALLGAPMTSNVVVNDLPLTNGAPMPYLTFLLDRNYTSAARPRYGQSYSGSGLFLRTHLSDRFTTFMQTDQITGAGGIAEITKLDVSEGFLYADDLNLLIQLSNMLQQAWAAGGDIGDYIEVVYGEDMDGAPEIPIYCGGIRQAITFGELVNTAASAENPMGQLGGVARGQGDGGHVHIHANNYGGLQVLVSIVPQPVYYQGNAYFTQAANLDFWRNAKLDCIGYQPLLSEEFAAFDTVVQGTTTPGAQNVDGTGITTFSYGLQPYAMEYMTAVDESFGRFCFPNDLGALVLNRTFDQGLKSGGDASPGLNFTTYVMPTEFVKIFADNTATSTPFWVTLYLGAKKYHSAGGAMEIPNIR